MRLTLNNTKIFASTGGRDFDPSGPVVLFVHGSGQSHLGFMLQHRFFANRGFQCITPDMPGHGLSNGEALTTIEAMADWYAQFMQGSRHHQSNFGWSLHGRSNRIGIGEPLP